MGLFSSVGRVLGLSGSGSAGRKSQRQLNQIAEQVRNFTPIRIRSALGTGTLDAGGLSFDLDPRLAAGAGSALDFFGSTASKLAAFDEGDATARTLALLRQRRAEAFSPALSSLESRLLAQGRLGLGTGDRGGNPELTSFFAGEAMADLEAQLAASEEARRERAGLMQAAAGGLGLAQEAALPSQFMSGLFNVESLRAAREFAAANIRVGGVQAAQAGAERDLSARAGFFGSAIQGLLSRDNRDNRDK